MRFASLAVAGLAAALASAPAAKAYDIDFRGQSRASPQLKADLLAHVSGYAKHTYRCSFPFSVETALLPANYTPRTPLYRANSPQRS